MNQTCIEAGLSLFEEIQDQEIHTEGLAVIDFHSIAEKYDKWVKACNIKESRLSAIKTLLELSVEPGNKLSHEILKKGYEQKALPPYFLQDEIEKAITNELTVEVREILYHTLTSLRQSEPWWRYK